MSDKQVDNGGDAFPCVLPSNTYVAEGLSKLDWFAGQAMTFIGADALAQAGDTMPYEIIAIKAYAMAEAMLKERKELLSK